jgi:hypothetical protein
VTKKVIIQDSETNEMTTITNSTLFNVLYERVHKIHKEVKTFITQDEIVNQFYSIKENEHSKIANLIIDVNKNELILEWVG